MIIKDSVFFHEDDYCQIELLPVQNLFTKHGETVVIKDYSEKHFTEDGFINIISRNQVALPLSKLNITYYDFQSLLKQDALFHFDKIYTGYSSYRELKKNIHGFGFENYILYYEFCNNLILNAWVDYNNISDTLNVYPEKLQNAFFKLGEDLNLILVDWNQLTTIILKNKTSVTDYVTDVL